MALLTGLVTVAEETQAQKAETKDEAATSEIHAQLLSAKEEVASLKAQLSTNEVRTAREAQQASEEACRKMEAVSPQMFDISSDSNDVSETFDISSDSNDEFDSEEVALPEMPFAPSESDDEDKALHDAILKEVEQSVQERTEALLAEGKQALNQAQQKHREEVKDLRVYKVLYESRDEPVQINGNALNFAVAWNKTSLQGGTLRG